MPVATDSALAAVTTGRNLPPSTPMPRAANIDKEDINKQKIVIIKFNIKLEK